MAVLLGLVMYTASFVAEVVRGGIQSVQPRPDRGGRRPGPVTGQTMRLVVLPQALRVIIPPLTNQYLNLTKNSSLAVAIGYPDVVSIANTALNQTGRAVECIAIIMLVYLTTSLSTSAADELVQQARRRSRSAEGHDHAAHLSTHRRAPGARSTEGLVPWIGATCSATGPAAGPC
jgi:ABC-type amino acid transport system permease subunit